MIKKFLTAIILVFFPFLISAHKINGYKYIIIQQQGYSYVEDELYYAFSSIGFTVFKEGDEIIKDDEKAYVLYAHYDIEIHYGYPSNLGVVLKNTAGSDIYTSITSGMGRSVRVDMARAVSSLKRNMKKLNYSFDKSMSIQSTPYNIPYTTWSEDRIKEYLKNKPASSIEGIYKNYSNDEQFYRFAIIKHEEKYYGIIIESGNNKWDKGDIKLSMSYIDKKTYDAEYYDYNRLKINGLASYDNRILKIETELGSYDYVKIYPSSNISTDSNKGYNTTECLGNGSGILVSSKYIVTNYHVVKDANRIEVSFDNNGNSESYNAKILSCDQSNDLAIIAIKDEKFKDLPEPPFKIINNSVDVGTAVFTMGFPLSNILGDEIKVTDGIISSKSGYEGNTSNYQISVPVQPGNSGSALFDRRGNIVGIVNAGIPNAENIGYAIKSSYINNLLESSPIDITIPKGSNNLEYDLPTLIKKLKPYIAIIKIY